MQEKCRFRRFCRQAKPQAHGVFCHDVNPFAGGKNRQKMTTSLQKWRITGKAKIRQ